MSASKSAHQISPEEVHKIALLSKIQMEGDELEKITKDFNQILDFVDQISEVDTSGIEPMGHVLGLENVTRPDEPGRSFNRSEVESIAPEFNAGFFVVPRVIETEG